MTARRGFCPDWLVGCCQHAIDDAWGKMTNNELHGAEHSILCDLQDHNINVNFVAIKRRANRNRPCKWFQDNHKAGQLDALVGDFEVTIDFYTSR